MITNSQLKQEKPKELYSNFRGATVEEVIKVTVNEGEGITGDPIIRVTYWYTKDGTLIGCDDHMARKFVPTKKEEHHV